MDYHGLLRYCVVFALVVVVVTAIGIVPLLSLSLLLEFIPLGIIFCYFIINTNEALS